jgi:hypothetical protein
MSIAEAAKQLGITEDAVRKRIKRGVLYAKKVDNKWLVVLDGQDTTRPEQRAESHRRDKNRDESLVQHLSSEVEFLRAQIAVKDQQIAERDKDLTNYRDQLRYKDLLIARLEDRLIQLPSLNEPQPRQQESERVEPLAAQSEESRNAMSRFWRWFIEG